MYELCTELRLLGEHLTSPIPQPKPKLPPQQIRGGFSVQYSGSAINLSLEFRTLVRTVRRPAYVNLPMAWAVKDRLAQATQELE